MSDDVCGGGALSSRCGSRKPTTLAPLGERVGRLVGPGEGVARQTMQRLFGKGGSASAPSGQNLLKRFRRTRHVQLQPGPVAVGVDILKN